MVLIPIASKNSLENKTGSWRNFRPVITERCTGCGICVKFCPDACIELVDRPQKHKKFQKIAKVDYDYCKGCLICNNECPFKAVDSKREDSVAKK